MCSYAAVTVEAAGLAAAAVLGARGAAALQRVAERKGRLCAIWQASSSSGWSGQLVCSSWLCSG
jgi:hypothetical protein